MSDTTATPMLTAVTPAPKRPASWLPWRRQGVRRRVTAGAKGIALAPIAVYVALFPAGLGTAATNWAFGTHVLAFELLVVIVLMALTACVIWWIVGVGLSSRLRFGRFQPAVQASAVAGFAAVSIERALSEAPFEAALAVWRADQRPADLTAAFDVLQERIETPAPALALAA